MLLPPCVLPSNGATAIIPVADIEAAKKFKSEGFLVGAERNTQRVDFADFGNSPFEYTKERVEEGDRLPPPMAHVLLRPARSRSSLWCILQYRCSWRGAVLREVEWWCLCRVEQQGNIEDNFLPALRRKVHGNNGATAGSDAVGMSLQLWKRAKADPIGFVKSSDHYQRLVNNGVESDAAFCLEANTVSVVPSLIKEEGKKVRNSGLFIKVESSKSNPANCSRSRRSFCGPSGSRCRSTNPLILFNSSISYWSGGVTFSITGAPAWPHALIGQS